jgi:hypothetical protein
MQASADNLWVLSRIPGRLRLHLPGRGEDDPRRIESDLRRLEGVEDVQANPLTGNVLVRFDPRLTTDREVLATVEAASRALAPSPPPAVGGSDLNGRVLLRAGMYGVLGHALVDAVFYTVVFAEPFGLPLAGLGALHLGFDVLAWSAALVPVLEAATQPGGTAGAASKDGHASHQITPAAV